jgi:hypothetical protein
MYFNKKIICKIKIEKNGYRQNHKEYYKNNTCKKYIGHKLERFG